MKFQTAVVVETESTKDVFSVYFETFRTVIVYNTCQQLLLYTYKDILNHV